MGELNWDKVYCAAIELFIRKWCKKYMIAFEDFFEDEEILSLGSASELGNEASSVGEIGNAQEYLSKAAEVLGTDVEAIINMDDSVVGHYYEKYPYFKLYPQAVDAYNEQWRDYIENHPSNLNAIKSKIIEQAKEYDTYLPGIFHKDASIENISVGTHMFASFPDAITLWESYIEMVDTAQTLFSKILFGQEELTSEEINEYNFLVSSLAITEAVLPAKCYLHFSKLAYLMEIYLEEGYTEFYSFARVNLGIFSEVLIHPWCFKETAADKDLIQKYVNIHPIINGKYTKEYLRKYIMQVKNYCCAFNWSDAPYVDFDTGDSKIKERTEVYVSKPEDTFNEWSDICEQVNRLSSPPSLGGITMPVRELPYQHYHPHQDQMLSWIKKVEKRQQALRGEA